MTARRGDAEAVPPAGPLVHLDELVVQRPAGSPPEALLPPLTAALAAHGVPDPAGVATAVVEALAAQGALP